jgi:hypothetical protein
MFGEKGRKVGKTTAKKNLKLSSSEGWKINRVEQKISPYVGWFEGSSDVATIFPRSMVNVLHRSQLISKIDNIFVGILTRRFQGPRAHMFSVCFLFEDISGLVQVHTHTTFRRLFMQNYVGHVVACMLTVNS